MPEKTLGEFIRDRRIELKTGLRSLAKVVEITPSYLSDIEYGRRVPSDDVLRKIAVQLTLEFDELMARSGRVGEEAERHLSMLIRARSASEWVSSILYSVRILSSVPVIRSTPRSFSALRSRKVIAIEQKVGH